MRIRGYIRGNGATSDRRVRDFIDAMGGSISPRDGPDTSCDLAVQAGYKTTPALTDAMDRGIPFIILENPVWGRKDDYYTWAYNGLNGLGFTGNTVGLPHRECPDLLPWREWDSGETVIYGQVEHDRALRGLDIYEWVERIQDILPHSVFREHPGMVDSRFNDVEPLEDVLLRTSLAVTYSSTVGAEAVIAGIPTISMCAGSLAYAVSSHTLSDTPITPDRSEWIQTLAWRHIGDPSTIPTQHILGAYDEARSRAEAGQYDYLQGDET